MAHLIHILVTGHADPDLQQVAQALRNLPKVSVQTRLLTAQQHDPLGEGGPPPAILIHFLGTAAEQELSALIQRPAATRPELLVVGAIGGDAPRIMRMAMQAGARDFIIHPVAVEELVAEVRNIVAEHAADAAEPHTLTAFLSPKGGGGASTIAEGVAHIIAARFGLPTLLMDLDCQFGTQYLNLDLRPDKGLKEALEEAAGLDEIALRAYVCKHPSGLQVIGTLPGQILLPGEVTEQHLYRLLELLMQSYSQIVVDLPCTIDSTFSLIIEKMRHIVLVVQQDFQNIRNGQKLIHILRDELQVPPDHIGLIVNRFELNNPITVKDIEQSLQLRAVGCIPSDFRSVNDAANLGLPLMEHAPKSPVSLALLELAGWVIGQPVTVAKPPGFWSKLRTSLKGGG